MRHARSIILILVTIAAIRATTDDARATSPERRATGEIQFSAHELATGLRGGYQVIVTDLNKDGRLDIVALASGLPELVWFENPTWTRHVIAGDMSQMINVAAYDIDGDGIPELALAQGFTTSAKTSKGIVSILTHGADVTA